ncbi:MAG: hypothetical protein IJH86_03495 [Clostridia bacterium]|nr:hypothetical protein [Clostridia bacterium]
MTRIEKILNRLEWLLLFVWYTLSLLQRTTLKAVEGSVALGTAKLFCVMGLILIALILSVKALAAGTAAGNRGRAMGLFLLRMGVILLAVVSFNVNVRSTDSWVLLVVALTCLEQREASLFRTAFLIGAFVVAVFFFLSMLGIVPNNRGNSFGFIYRTHYACYLLSLALFYCLLKNGDLGWRGELGLALLAVLDAAFIRGKTLLALLILLMFFTYWRHYRRCRGVPYQDAERYTLPLRLAFRALYAPVALADWVYERLRLGRHKRAALRLGLFSFLLCAALLLVCSRFYRVLKPATDLIPGMNTLKSRLLLGQMAFEEYPIRLFGFVVPQQGLSKTEDIVDFYFALDSAYIKLLMEYGLLCFTGFMGLMTWAQLRLYRAGRYYAMLLLTLYALDAITEYWMVSVSNNMFILLASCILSRPAAFDGGEKAPVPARKRGMKRCLPAVAGVAVLVAFCVTAYPVSMWRGWTPAYGATVVLPGRFMDGVGGDRLREQRLSAAAEYLLEHPEARCILDEAGDAAALTASGIDGGRISLCAPSSDIDEMLTRAAAVISAEGLPERLTVCTFDMQQARIARHAKRLGIPVNALTAAMPRALYLPNYLIEQGRVFR